MSNSDTTLYKVLRGCIQVPRNVSKAFRMMVKQGEVFPASTFSSTAIEGWLAEGKIEPVYPAVVKAVPFVEETGVEVAPFVDTDDVEVVPLVNPGIWKVDPDTLIDKTMEDLLLMVLDISPDYDVASLTDMGVVVRLLTKNFNRELADTIAPVSDKSSAIAMCPEAGVVDLGSRAPSSEASSALAEAKERARAEDIKVAKE